VAKSGARRKISAHARDRAVKHVGINGQLLSDSATYRSAGVSGYIRQLLAHLPAATPDLRLTAFVPAAARVASDDLKLHPSARWDTRRPLQRILWEQLVLPEIARRNRLDLLHATVNIAPVLGACPTVVTVHDLSFLRYPEAFPPLQRLYLRTQVLRSLRAARRVIAVSAATKQDVIRLASVPDSQVDVVPNGVDLAFCPAPSQEVETFRSHQGLPPRFILHLGTLEPRKNLVRLVQAFGQARAASPAMAGVRLVLAGGKGWDYANIFQKVGQLGLEADVIFAGYVPDEELPWWYRAATVFAYPSLLEGFGLPVLEAMACGVPVVTSNVSALPEVAGDAALLVDPTSVDQLAEALLAVLGDASLAREMGQRGRQRAAGYRWEHTAQATAAVYRRSLGLTAWTLDATGARVLPEHETS
jgi:glycosyltransferase involved in cell wall biosynthesis